MRKTDKGIQIFCPLRKKWFVNTPEEWVRQHVIQYLHVELHYNLSQIIAEYPLTINGLNQRIDLLVMKNCRPYILIECKKPKVAISQRTLNQSLRYAQEIGCVLVYLSNGVSHFFFSVNQTIKKVEKLNQLPYSY